MANTTDRYKAYIRDAQAYTAKAQAADPAFQAWQQDAARYSADMGPSPSWDGTDYFAEWFKQLPPEQQQDYTVAHSDVKAQNAKSLKGRLGSAAKLIPLAVGSIGAAGALGLLGGTGLGSAAGFPASGSIFSGAGAAAGGGMTAAELAAAAGSPELGLAAQTGLGTASTAAGTTAAGAATAGGAATTGVGSMLSGVSNVELAKLGLAGIGTLAGYKSSKDATAAAESAAKSATNSADAATQLGRDNLDFTKQQYADAKPYRDAAAKTAQEVSEAQLAQMKQQDELAREYAEYNRTTFRPLEQSIVSDAAGYDTPEKRNAAAIAAQADVNKGFAAVNSARTRQLAASGIDPGSTRAMSVMDEQAIEQAKANAGAAYTARKGVETTGFARKMDAASLGRNLPSSQATTAGLALTAGNSATGNSGAALQAVNTGVPQVQNAYNSAVQGAATGGGLYSSAAQLAQRAGVISADQWGQLGDSLGNWANSKGGNAVLNKWFGG